MYKEIPNNSFFMLKDPKSVIISQQETSPARMAKDGKYKRESLTNTDVDNRYSKVK